MRQNSVFLGISKIEDGRLRSIQRANKKYHSYYSAKDQYMLRRLKARLDWDGSEEHKLDYLKADDMKSARCTFISEVSSVLSVECVADIMFLQNCINFGLPVYFAVCLFSA